MKPRPRVTHHWRQRVIERLGPDVDPEALFQRIASSIIAGGDEFARFKSRTCSHPDQSIYKVVLPEHGVFFAVISDDMVAITLLHHDIQIKRSPKAKPKWATSPWWREGSGAKRKRRKRELL